MLISLQRISMLFDAGSFVDHDPGAETLLSLRHCHPLKGRWKEVQHYKARPCVVAKLSPTPREAKRRDASGISFTWLRN
ncbi:hypothetical protein QFZ97_007278 [Paraburkholderia youngii]